MSVEKFLSQQIRLPTAPAIAARILEAVKADGESYHSLAAVIATDPALTAKVLSIANSSLYALPRKVTKIEQAISLIGLNGLKNIALSFVVMRSMGTPAKSGFDFNRFMRRAVTGAVGAELAAKAIGQRGDDFFASALLQDIGMLVFALAAPETYGRVMDEENSSGDPLCVVEQRHFGCDHQELGAEVLRRWGLPESLCAPIRHHHKLTDPPEPLAHATDVLYLADKIASLYHGFHSGERSREINAMLSERYRKDERAVGELIDAVASRAEEMLAEYEVDAGAIKPYSQLLQEANDELGRLNLTYEQLVMELKQAKAKAEKLATDLKDANTRLREMASRDGLTGLYNHRHFQEMLRKEISEAARYKRPLSLILFDIDFFKKVNDGHGHPAGDAVLKALAAFVEKTIRTCDLVARYGGEEFALILPETDARNAVILAERIRRGIEAMEIPIGGGQNLHVTVSLGLCEFREGDPENSQQRIIDATDKALYAAKHGGRNRVVVAR